MADEIAPLDELAELHLQRIAAGAEQFHHVAGAHPPMLSREIEDAYRQIGQLREDDLFALDLRDKAVLLLIERVQEEQDSGLPVRLRIADRGLGLA